MRIIRDRLGPDSGSERGFGLIEIVVSMLIIALISMSFLPLAIQAIKQTFANANLTTATQIVAQQLEQVRAAGSSCSAVKAFAATVPAEVVNTRGSFQPHLYLDVPAGDVCDATVRTLPLRIWVTKPGSSQVLAEANKLVLLDAP